MTVTRDIYLDIPDYVTNVITDTDADFLLVLQLYYSTWLYKLGITEDEAATAFCLNYNDAYTMYKRAFLLDIIRKNALTNKRKYDLLCEAFQATFDPITNYDRTEESTHTREPDITRTASGESETETETGRDTTNQMKQTRTTTTTPNQYTTTTAHDVAPENSSTYNPQTLDTVTESGSTATTETYSGNPDETHTTGTDSTTGTTSATETETGTETTTIESHIYGNIGVTSAQTMLEQSLELAPKMDVWRIIEKDIAAAVCIQVW